MRQPAVPDAPVRRSRLPPLPRRHLRDPRWRTSQAQLPDVRLRDAAVVRMVPMIMVPCFASITLPLDQRSGRRPLSLV